MPIMWQSRRVQHHRQRRQSMLASIHIGCILLLQMLFAHDAHASTQQLYRNARLSTRIVQTRYGRLQGLVLPLDNFKYLRPVEVHLGVPYATPPTMSNRFSPTRAPLPWDGVYTADRFSAVCPQRLPDIHNETAALGQMPKGRLEYLRRLLPLLQNQSEDCLYLNVFAPMHAATVKNKLPVIVFLHGESFEWNGGNPYDGTVLASYGEVVVVTLNYRLGILGFLNANPAPHLRARVANYGLMDQIAALQWIKENIAKFGGDPDMVTLAGHGSGAACINFLMTSPTMVQDLFHRAILLSGSSASSWALVEDPAAYAVRLAQQVNCTVPADLMVDHEEIVDCLRDVPLVDLQTADIWAPNYLTAFGPSVDGVVIRRGLANLHDDDYSNADDGAAENRHNDIANGMRHHHAKGSGGGGGGGSNSDAVGRFDLLFGVVTGEALWRFSAADIQSGFESERRDRILRTYVRNAYTYHLSEIFYTIVNEYTDWERTAQHPINTRDAVVAALSDAQFVAPMVSTGDTLAPLPAGPGLQKTGPKCFFYVFDYQTKDGDYPQRMGTVHGEDLPYVFGAPLVEGFSHFPQNYTKSEVALSEALIVYWSNFARTGNPNEHHRQDSVLVASKERNRFRSIVWDEYDPVHQKYLEIGMKPRMKNHFRAHQLSIWLRLIPELHRAGMEDVIVRHNLFRNHDDPTLYEGAVKPNSLSRLAFLGSTVDDGNKATRNTTTIEPASLTVCNPSGTYTFVSQHRTAKASSPALEPSSSFGGIEATAGAISQLPAALLNASGDSNSITSATYATTSLLGGFEASAVYSTALSVTIAIGCSLLILNVLIFAGVYYQRDKTRLEMKMLQQHNGGGGGGAGGSGGGGGGHPFDDKKLVPLTSHHYYDQQQQHHSHGHHKQSTENSVSVDMVELSSEKSAAATTLSHPHMCGIPMHLKVMSGGYQHTTTPDDDDNSCGATTAMTVDDDRQHAGGGGGGSCTIKSSKPLGQRNSAYNAISTMTLPHRHYSVVTTQTLGPAATVQQQQQQQQQPFNYKPTTTAEDGGISTFPRMLIGSNSSCSVATATLTTGGMNQSENSDSMHQKYHQVPRLPPVRSSSPAESNQSHHQHMHQQQQQHQHQQQLTHTHQQHCHQQQPPAPPHHQHQHQQAPDLFHMHPQKNGAGGRSVAVLQPPSPQPLPTSGLVSTSLAPMAPISHVIPQAAMTEMRV